MKKNVLLTTLGLLFLAFLFYEASSGVAAAQNADRTGAPGSDSSCNSCHGGGNFNASVSVAVLDGETAVTAYEPGKKYTFRVTVNASNAPAGYGFQAVGVVAEGNANAGSFGTAPTGTQVTSLNGRQYFEHSGRSTGNSWAIEWTAPAAGTGEVRFYAAGNAVNGDFNSGGDSPDRLDSPLSLSENVASSLAAVEQLDLNMKVFPNPVQDRLNLQVEGSENGRFELRLLNTAGQLVRSAQVLIANGRSNEQLEVTELPAGLYFLHLTDGRRVKTMHVVKE